MMLINKHKEVTCGLLKVRFIRGGGTLRCLLFSPLIISTACLLFAFLILNLFHIGVSPALAIDPTSATSPTSSTSTPTSALTTSPSASNASSPSASVNLDLINGIAIRILDAAGISEINDLVFNLDASSTGTFSASNFNVEVDTSNRTGYKLYMTSDYQEPSSPGTYTTALVNLDDSNYTIPTLSSAVTKTDFSSGGDYRNRWGYSLDDTTYSPVPVHSTEQCIAGCNGEKDEPVAHDKTPIYVGMNVSLASASGTYRNNLVFSAIANPIPTDYTLSFNLNGGSAPSTDPNAFADMTASEVAAQHTFTIPTGMPELTGHTFSYWSDTAGNHYNPGDTITVIGNEEYIGAETLTANWDLATYTINIANSNTTSNPASSTTISYGGTTTVTVTPSSGYYLSSVTCPTGYTCTGYNTGTDVTTTQTVTITNNGTEAGGTLSFGGTSSVTPLSECSTVSTGGTYTVNGVTYIKLADDKCYTKSSQGTTTWANAAGKCPSGTHLPTQAEFNTLVGKYSGGGLYTATGWSGVYWSATSYDSTYAYYLGVYSSFTYIDRNSKSGSYHVVCMAGADISNVSYLQDVTECPAALTEGAQYTLTDKGETSKSYSTSKLADEKCWMTSNYNVSGNKTLSSTYYNVNSSYTLPASSTSGFSDNATAYVYNDSTYGGYYSWKAATADTSPSSGTASYDICPKGWRLPTQDEFTTLISKYSASSAGSKLTQSPVNMKYGGLYYNSSPLNQGSYGLYWSSSAYSSTNAYYLNFYSSSADTNNRNKSRGLSVRCVFGS